MGEVLTVSMTFPTVLFTFSLVVVIGYWLVVLVGVADIDLLDAGTAGETSAAGALLPTTRAAREIPVTIVLSLWIIISWCGCAAATIVLDDTGFLDGLGGILPQLLVLVLVPLAAWIVTVALVMPLGRLYRTGDAASHHDFVGKVCVIRTADVNDEFGQAEITSADGSTAIVQVRTGSSLEESPAELTRGATALIFDYDARGGFFRVTGFDPTFGTRNPENT